MGHPLHASPIPPDQSSIPSSPMSSPTARPPPLSPSPYPSATSGAGLRHPPYRHHPDLRVEAATSRRRATGEPPADACHDWRVKRRARPSKTANDRPHPEFPPPVRDNPTSREPPRTPGSATRDQRSPRPTPVFVEPQPTIDPYIDERGSPTPRRQRGDSAGNPATLARHDPHPPTSPPHPNPKTRNVQVLRIKRVGHSTSPRPQPTPPPPAALPVPPNTPPAPPPPPPPPGEPPPSGTGGVTNGAAALPLKAKHSSASAWCPPCAAGDIPASHQSQWVNVL